MRSFKVFVVTLLVTVVGLAELYVISLFGNWGLIATLGLAAAYFGVYPEEANLIEQAVKFIEEP